MLPEGYHTTNGIPKVKLVTPIAIAVVVNLDGRGFGVAARARAGAKGARQKLRGGATLIRKWR